jgi:hypothetical protein
MLGRRKGPDGVMRGKLNRSSVVLTCALAGIMMSGCGGTKGDSQVGEGLGSHVSPGEVVATVGHSSVTESMLDHWLVVEAAAQYESVPKGPLPAGVIPDPPKFRACIAYLRHAARREGSSKTHTNVELTAECETDYHRLRARTLEMLIAFRWVEAEAAHVGVSITNATIIVEAKRLRRELFRSASEYEVYLRRTGQTLADQYQRLRVDLLSTGLQKRFLSEGTAVLARYFHEFPRKWAAQTSCRSTDVNPSCKEYKGSVAPQAEI